MGAEGLDIHGNIHQIPHLCQFRAIRHWPDLLQGAVGSHDGEDLLHIPHIIAVLDHQRHQLRIDLVRQVEHFGIHIACQDLGIALDVREDFLTVPDDLLAGIVISGVVTLVLIARCQRR